MIVLYFSGRVGVVILYPPLRASVGCLCRCRPSVDSEIQGFNVTNWVYCRTRSTRVQSAVHVEHAGGVRGFGSRAVRDCEGEQRPTTTNDDVNQQLILVATTIATTATAAATASDAAERAGVSVRSGHA